MNNTNIWQDPTALDAILRNMSDALKTVCITKQIEQPLMVGIHTGGIWIAQRLQHLLEISEPLGALDISFYRDDFTRIGLHPLVRPSHLPIAIDDRNIILVDDVLYTGRTIRAALNALFDYGRPALVLLAVLAVRNGRELPIAPDITGLQIELSPDQYLKLEGPEPLSLVLDNAS